MNIRYPIYEGVYRILTLEDTFFQDVESPLPNVVIQAEAHKKTNVRSEVSTVISG